MTQKTIMIGLVAVAFVAGSIMTGTMASAEKGGVGDNLIVDALNGIAAAISGIDPDVTVNVDPTPITVNAPQGDKGDKGDTGAKGDKGDTGDQGPPGSQTLVQQIVTGAPTTFAAGQSLALIATCPSGTFVAGAAVDVNTVGFDVVEITFLNNGARVVVMNNDAGNRIASAQATCFSLTP